MIKVMKCAEILLILLSSSVIFISALPSLHSNRVAKDESDNSGGSIDASHTLPVTRRGKINVKRFMGRESDAPICGYEVRYDTVIQ